FNGLKAEGDSKQNRLIVVGLDENGKTLVNMKMNLSGISAASLGMGIGFITDAINGIAEHGSPCPPYCQ
ncbi:MAG: hypothetical protein WBO31_14385, partial [Saprospiraceae bacterium]